MKDLYKKLCNWIDEDPELRLDVVSVLSILAGAVLGAALTLLFWF